MGKFDFPWDFALLFLIFSPCQKKEGGFGFAEFDLQHGSNGSFNKIG